MVAENLRAKLEAEQSLLSDVTSPLSDIDTDQGHFKDVSAVERLTSDAPDDETVPATSTGN